MVVRRVDQGVGQGEAVIDHVVEADFGAQAELSGEHRAGQVGVEQQGPPRPARQGAGQGQYQASSALRRGGSS